MILKLIVYGTLACLAMADVKHLPRTYLPPSSPQAIGSKLFVSAPVAQDVPDVSKNEIVENDLILDIPETKTNEASKDPAYGNSPFGFNGVPGGFPGAYPNPSFPGQFYPNGGGFPPQGFPGQGVVGAGSGFPHSQGFVNPGLPSQGFPGPFPGQGFQGQGFPGQGFPGQGFPGQGFPGQGFPGQGFPGQGFPGQGFIGSPFPNYPIYYSSPNPGSEQFKTETNNDTEGNKLRSLVSNIDTQYDATDGGYLYNKPSVRF